MSIIQTIRDKGAAIVIGVIALSLIGFLLMDASTGAGGGLFGGRSTSIGSVGGETLELEEYNKRIKNAEQQNPNFKEMRGQMMQQVWDQMIGEKLITDEFNSLGLAFTPKEMTATMLSDDAPQSLKQAFSDPQTQQYDIEKVKQWWNGVRKSKNKEQRDAVDAQVIEPMRLFTLYNKYTSMISASIYMPSWLVQKEDNDTRSFSNISYVAIPYSVISDSLVKVSDKEIEEYLAKHKKKYKQEAGRIISYVTFSAAPNAQDTAKLLENMNTLKPQLLADSNTKAFVARNISAINFEDLYKPKARIDDPFKDSIINAGSNAVIGPYLNGKNYVLAKLIGVKTLPDSIKVRHILLGTVNPQTGEALMADSVAKIKIDSIQAAIASGADFNTLETKYTTDMEAHKTNGEMTFDIVTIQGTGFAKEFGDFIMNEKGEMKKAVKTQFGWHYIEILNKINPQPVYKIAYLAKEIIPSDETINAANAAATRLSAGARTEKALDEYLKKNGLTKLSSPSIIKENEYTLGNMQDARAIIKWAFEAKPGEVSAEPFPVGETFVVASVSKIVKEGTPDAVTGRPMVESFVRNEKKSSEIMKKLGSPATLEAAAAVYTQPVLTAGADSTLTFTAQMVNGIGQEPKVIGASFNKAYQAKVSEPIAGNTGVFVLKVNSIGLKTAVGLTPAQQISSKMMQERQSAMNQSFEALKKMAEIKDKRSKFF